MHAAEGYVRALSVLELRELAVLVRHVARHCPESVLGGKPGYGNEALFEKLEAVFGEFADAVGIAYDKVNKCACY